VQPPIYFDPRWNGNHGIGRFSQELQRRLPGLVPLRIAGPKLSPFDPIASSLALARCHAGCYFSPGFNPPLRSPIPFAFTIHDLVHLQVPSESSAVRRAYYRAVVRPATRKAFCILTVSEYSRREIAEWSGIDPQRIRVVGNGVSQAFVPGPPVQAREPFFLHVGRRAGHKNIAGLLQAFSISRLPAQFHLLFTGEPDQATVSQAAAFGVADRVRFARAVDDTALLNLYHRATALVFPSLHEGFGLPIIEAMATGTPVITSTTTSMPEVAGEGNALFADPREPEQLAGAMRQLAEDRLLWNRLATRGLARSSDFTWERVCARVRRSLELPD
jgi:glycosyltransferase involved in cell wall biosynthesis